MWRIAVAALAACAEPVRSPIANRGSSDDDHDRIVVAADGKTALWCRRGERCVPLTAASPPSSHDLWWCPRENATTCRSLAHTDARELSLMLVVSPSGRYVTIETCRMSHGCGEHELMIDAGTGQTLFDRDYGGGMLITGWAIDADAWYTIHWTPACACATVLAPGRGTLECQGVVTGDELEGVACDDRGRRLEYRIRP
jgi:hypothetical protein